MSTSAASIAPVRPWPLRLLAGCALLALAGSALALAPGHAQDDHAAPAHAPAPAPASAPAASATKAPAKPATPAAAPAAGHDDHAPVPDPKPLPAKADPGEAAPTEPDAILTALRDGNRRWVAGTPKHPATSAARRELTAEGQKPFVTVLTCADSRLPVERLFDRGVGEVFVIRVAGNVAGESEMGTIEYGLGHLHTPVLVVMGHTRCGAVAAAATDAPVHGMVARLIGRIDPAVERARRNHPGAEPAELARLAISENVWQTIYDLIRGSDEIRALVSGGRVKVVGAVCDVATGKVEWLGEHPWQTELLQAMAPGSAAHAAAVPHQPPPVPGLPAAPAAHADAAAPDTAHADKPHADKSTPAKPHADQTSTTHAGEGGH